MAWKEEKTETGNLEYLSRSSAQSIQVRDHQEGICKMAGNFPCMIIHWEINTSNMRKG